jgi:hypothetical protein
VIKCEVSARLESTDDGLEVHNGDWATQEFTPSGVVQWAWSVDGTKLGSHGLRVELRPAIIVGDANTPQAGGGGAEELSIFTTPVSVTGGPLQYLYAWWDDNYGKLSAILLAVGAAIVGTRSWILGLRDKDRGGTTQHSTGKR